MLYTITAENKTGVNGIVNLSNGKKIKTSHPLLEDDGFNPEELMALAWSTCLNETIQSIMKSRGLTNQSTTKVEVQLQREASGVGYYFQVIAFVNIEDITLKVAEDIVSSAHHRCPVSKLIKDAKTIQIHVSVS